MRLFPTFGCLALLAVFAVGREAPEPRVLVYTRNGPNLEGKTGYGHDNIPDSIAAIRQLGAAHGFAGDASDDPQAFTAASLRGHRKEACADPTFLKHIPGGILWAMVQPTSK
jgi:hypothetical protein